MQLSSARFPAQRVAKREAVVTRPQLLGSTCAAAHFQHQWPHNHLICRATLPHMDEEIEHMQWQLDKRSHDGSSHAGSSSNHHDHDHDHNSRKTGKAGNKQRLVFHERRSKHTRPGHHHTHHHSPSVGSSSSSGSDDGTGTPPPTPADRANEPMVQHQMQEAPHQEGQYYYCMQLNQLAASLDLRKVRDRLMRHTQQDGGCLLSLTASQGGWLTHLLLQLQHKQLHDSPNQLLMLQPFTFGRTAGTNRSAAALHEVAPAAAAAAAAADSNNLQFFVTWMPLQTLLSLQAVCCDMASGGVAAAAAVDDIGDGAAAPATVDAAALVSSGTFESVDSMSVNCSTFTSSSSSVLGSSATESSGDELASKESQSDSSKHGRAYTSSSSSSGLLEAASRSGNSAAAILWDAACRGCLTSQRVGTHGDSAALAARVMSAVAAGAVHCLHVKGHPAAHAAAYAALAQAAAGLAATSHQQLSFGVLVVQGSSHEHVHAAAHGHAAAGTAAADAQRAVAEQHQHSHSKVLTDASMDVGGFGAAYYGISAVGRHEEQQQQGMKHKHAQEIWLCVLPLSFAL